MYKYTKIKKKIIISAYYYFHYYHLQHITIFTTSLLLFITSAVVFYANMLMFQRTDQDMKRSNALLFLPFQKKTSMLFLSLAESHIILPQGKQGRRGTNQAKRVMESKTTAL